MLEKLPINHIIAPFVHDAADVSAALALNCLRRATTTDAQTSALDRTTMADNEATTPPGGARPRATLAHGDVPAGSEVVMARLQGLGKRAKRVRKNETQRIWRERMAMDAQIKELNRGAEMMAKEITFFVGTPPIDKKKKGTKPNPNFKEGHWENGIQLSLPGDVKVYGRNSRTIKDAIVVRRPGKVRYDVIEHARVRMEKREMWPCIFRNAEFQPPGARGTNAYRLTGNVEGMVLIFFDSESVTKKREEWVSYGRVEDLPKHRRSRERKPAAHYRPGEEQEPKHQKGIVTIDKEGAEGLCVTQLVTLAESICHELAAEVDVAVTPARAIDAAMRHT